MCVCMCVCLKEDQKMTSGCDPSIDTVSPYFICPQIAFSLSKGFCNNFSLSEKKSPAITDILKVLFSQLCELVSNPLAFIGPMQPSDQGRIAITFFITSEISAEKKMHEDRLFAFRIFKYSSERYAHIL